MAHARREKTETKRNGWTCDFFLVINSKTGVLKKIIPGVQLSSTIKKRKLTDFGDRTYGDLSRNLVSTSTNGGLNMYKPSKMGLPKRNPNVKSGEISAKLTTNQSTARFRPHWRSHPPSIGPQFLAEHSWSQGHLWCRINIKNEEPTF